MLETWCHAGSNGEIPSRRDCSSDRTLKYCLCSCLGGVRVGLLEVGLENNVGATPAQTRL